ncbi:MAG: hypothetical protein QNL93_11855 [Opitutae bacterium]
MNSLRCHLILHSLSLLSVLHGTNSQKPNIVLFPVDDMGWVDSGDYGSNYYETAYMDKFAKCLENQVPLS